MHVLRDEFFIRKDFAFYDSGVATVLPLQMFHVYETLRRHVWVGHPPAGFDTERVLRDRGFVFSVVSQKTLGTMVGQQRGSVSAQIKLLKQLEWLSLVPRDHSPHSICLLGNVLHHRTVFWADVWLTRLYEWLARAGRMRASPKARFRNMDPGTFEHDCANYEGPSPCLDPSLDSIPLETRLLLVRRFVDVARTEGSEAAFALDPDDLVDPISNSGGF